MELSTWSHCKALGANGILCSSKGTTAAGSMRTVSSHWNADCSTVIFVTYVAMLLNCIHSSTEARQSYTLLQLDHEPIIRPSLC